MGDLGRAHPTDRAFVASPSSRVSPSRPEASIPCASDFMAALKQVPDGWWWSVGGCSVSADASIGPDNKWSDKATRIAFDDGFHSDLPQPATCADALRDVCRQAASAIEARRAATGTGAVHESAVLKADAPNLPPPSDKEQ